MFYTSEIFGWRNKDVDTSERITALNHCRRSFLVSVAAEAVVAHASGRTDLPNRSSSPSRAGIFCRAMDVPILKGSGFRAADSTWRRTQHGCCVCPPPPFAGLYAPDGT
jgi:hypothetical protein